MKQIAMETAALPSKIELKRYSAAYSAQLERMYRKLCLLHRVSSLDLTFDDLAFLLDRCQRLPSPQRESEFIKGCLTRSRSGMHAPLAA